MKNEAAIAKLRVCPNTRSEVDSLSAFDFLFESMTPSQRYERFMEFIIKFSGGNFKFSTELAAIVLNIREESVWELIDDKTLTCDKNRLIRVDELYAYKMKQKQIANEAIEKMVSSESKLSGHY